jgi:hypothetical protein
MTPKKLYTLLSLLLVSGPTFAGGAVPMSVQPMSLELGGVAAVAAVSLIIATQLIQRRK